MSPSVAGPLQIFTGREFLPDGFRHSLILCPFWGVPRPRFDEALEPNRYLQYVREGAASIQLAPPEAAQVAVLPFNWERYLNIAWEHPTWDAGRVERQREEALAKARSLAELAGEHDLPLLVFFAIDDPAPEVPLTGAVVFRPSLFRKTRRANELALPGLRGDLTADHCDGELPLREKGRVPVVGFCGYENLRLGTGGDRLRHVVASNRFLSRISRGKNREALTDAGSRIRVAALGELRRTNRVAANLLIRDQFWNGAVWRKGIDVARAARSRREYVENLLESEYALCVRGKGNFSFRLDEAMSLGRIPVLVDTDCVLPFEEQIAWDELIVRVPEDDLPTLGPRVRAHFDGLSAEEFRRLQQRCRSTWVRWLSPLGFFSNLGRCT